MMLVGCQAKEEVPLNKSLEDYFPFESSVTVFRESQGLSIRQLKEIERRDSSTLFRYVVTYFDNLDLRKANRLSYEAEYLITGNRVIEYLTGDVPNFLPLKASTIFKISEDETTWVDQAETIYGETVEVTSQIIDYLNNGVLIKQTADGYSRQIMLLNHQGIMNEKTSHSWALTDTINDRTAMKEEVRAMDIAILYSDGIHPLYDKVYFENVINFDRAYSQFINDGEVEVFDYLTSDSPLNQALKDFVYQGKRLDFVSIKIESITPLVNGDVNVEVTESIVQTLTTGETSKELHLVYTVSLENNKWLVKQYQPVESDE